MSGSANRRNERSADTLANHTLRNHIPRDETLNNVSEDDEIIVEDRDDEVYNLREWLNVTSLPSIYVRRLENHNGHHRHLERNQTLSSQEEVNCSLLRQQVMLDSGLFSVAIASDRRKSKAPSMIKLLKNRQIGISECHRRKSMSLFTEGDLCRIASRFVPNRPSEKSLDKFDGKVFLGFYSKDGNRFLNSSDDSSSRYIRIYDTRADDFTLVNRVTARDVAWAIIDADISPDSRRFIYSSWCDSFYMCNMDNDEQEAFCVTSNSNSRFCIFSLRFSSQGDKVLYGTNDHSLYIYDLERKHLAIRIKKAHDDDINSVAFADSSSQIIYSASDDGMCKIWDIRCLNEAIGKPEGVLKGHRLGITYIDPRDDGHHLITNGKDQCIKLWDLRKPYSSSNQKTMTTHSEHRYNYGSTCFSCIRLDGDSSIMTMRGHEIKNTLIRARFSPRFTTGQRFVYTGCSSGNVVIYDLLTGMYDKNCSIL